MSAKAGSPLNSYGDHVVSGARNIGRKYSYRSDSSRYPWRSGAVAKIQVNRMTNVPKTAAIRTTVMRPFIAAVVAATA